MKAKPKKTGRPRYEPTEQSRKMVRTMSAFGIPQLEISRVLNISIPTLLQYFWREIETGATDANARVADSLFRRAIDLKHPQGASCAIFWMKARAGWSDQAGAPPGKKEQAQAAAHNAGGEETGWGGDLQFDGESLN